MSRTSISLTVLASWALIPAASQAAKLLDVRPVDDEILMIHWADSEVIINDTGQGRGAFMGHESQGGDQLIKFGEPLDVVMAQQTSRYTLSSADDSGFGNAVKPIAAFRRTKVSGTAWNWPDPDLAFEHIVYLRLPKKLQQGKSYRVQLGAGLNSDKAQADFKFDIYSSIAEAVHVNLIGYQPEHTQAKSADLYMWLGDGGARDYSAYAGKKTWLVNVDSGEKHEVGRVSFWKSAGPDYGGWNYTASDVWNCDFSGFTGTGKFRLAVEGVGCSPEFELSPSIYFEPFKTSLRGFYYMRIGEPMTLTPPPRQPRLIPGKDPEGLRVILTTYGPWHPDWKIKGGDQWDNRDWSMYAEPGNPTNPNAFGGHSDAADWDRHAGHISIIWDMLLPYVLSNGKGGEDDLDILESGNGVPDVIDEARNEVDLWLRLRDRKGGYSSGLNNPSEEFTLMYQAAAKPYMAWANACNAAMLADAYRIAGKPELMAEYRDAALEAWGIAAGQDLDEFHSIGNGRTRGRDLKMMAAAYLYNVTGDRKFEDAMAEECVVKAADSETERANEYNQLWGVAAYLMCAKYEWQEIHYPELLDNMKLAVIAEAMAKNVANTERWPSRRSADNESGWFQSIQEVQRVCVAHAVAEGEEQDALLRALILEADWGLGRNPMNMVQMTGLGSRRPAYIYTSGRNDGVPEVHPGHTPYMNAEPWGEGFMADPKYYARRGYPEWEKWPHGEALWNAPYCYSNNEFTPQQSMRGKHCLLAYLYTLGKAK